MLEAHEWDDVLGRLVGIQFRGTERIASSTILDALGVTQDKEARQKAGKRRLRAKVSGDTLAKLLEIIEAERRRRALEQKAAESLPRGRGGDDTPVPPEDAGEAS